MTNSEYQQELEKAVRGLLEDMRENGESGYRDARIELITVLNTPHDAEREDVLVTASKTKRIAELELLLSQAESSLTESRAREATYAMALEGIATGFGDAGADQTWEDACLEMKADAEKALSACPSIPSIPWLEAVRAEAAKKAYEYARDYCRDRKDRRGWELEGHFGLRAASVEKP